MVVDWRGAEPLHPDWPPLVFLRDPTTTLNPAVRLPPISGLVAATPAERHGDPLLRVVSTRKRVVATRRRDVCRGGGGGGVWLDNSVVSDGRPRVWLWGRSRERLLEDVCFPLVGGGGALPTVVVVAAAVSLEEGHTLL